MSQSIPSRKQHELKTDPVVFAAVLARAKTHEIRLNDRDFNVGDELLLRETASSGADMKAGAPLVYTGRTLTRTVSHVQTGYGLGDRWCILSFAQCATPQGEPATVPAASLEAIRQHGDPDLILAVSTGRTSAAEAVQRIHAQQAAALAEWKWVPIKATFGMAWEIMLAHRAHGDAQRLAEDAWARAIAVAPAAPLAPHCGVQPAESRALAVVQNLELVIARLEQIAAGGSSLTMQNCAQEALPCARAALAAQSHDVQGDDVIGAQRWSKESEMLESWSKPGAQNVAPGVHTGESMLVDNLRRTLGNIKEASKLVDVRSLANLGLGFLEAHQPAHAKAMPRPGQQSVLREFADAVKSLCDDYSSRTGSVYISDVKGCIDALCEQHAADEMSDSGPTSLTGESLVQMLQGRHVNDYGYRMLLNGEKILFNLQDLLAIVNRASCSSFSAEEIVRKKATDQIFQAIADTPTSAWWDRATGGFYLSAASVPKSVLERGGIVELIGRPAPVSSGLAFNRHDLAAVAEARFGMSREETQNAAVSLYSRGLISYPHTNDRLLPDHLFDQLSRLVGHHVCASATPVDCDPSYKGPGWVAELTSAHSGIVLSTGPARLVGSYFSHAESNVYDLVRDQTLAMFKRPAGT